jgi:MarR family transcriptional regulator, 2-MHQ and catechol-resistance regulon repressor
MNFESGMTRKSQREAVAMHAWLIWLKAGRAIGHYAFLRIRDTGLGDTDFRVLEVLLHRGSLPVNAIGPMVDLNPGSVSVAVDRLFKKKLVERRESENDRRVRIVSLTKSGRVLVERAFQAHLEAVDAIFSELTAAELRSLESMMRKAGMQAKALAENRKDRKTNGNRN